VNEVDAAIAMPLGGVPWVPVIAGIGAAVLEVGVPFAGMAVRKHGKKSGPTEGHVSIGNIDSDKVPRSDTASGGAVIANTFSIKPDPNLLDPLAPPRPFAEHGDSGSLIFSRTRGSVPGTYPVVGLLWGGDALVSAANDIRAVFRILDLGPLYGSRAMLEQAWPANYSSFAPFTLGGAQHVLEYHAASGRVSIDEIAATTASSDGKTTPAISITERFTAKWAPDYTAFVPFVSDGDTYVLEYSAVTGEVFIERLAASAGGIVTTTTYKGKWTRGWTAFAAFTLGGLPHYLAYKQATGQVALDRLLHGGTGVTTLMTATWDERGLTAIVPLESDGNTYLLEYNATSGAMYVQRVRPDGRALTTTHTEGWQQGWSAIMPFTDKDKQPFYLAYMAGRGDATIGRLRSLGAGVERLSYVTDWPRDVTALAPLVLPRGPHLLRYAAGGKAVVEILHTARSP
jgi:hypothetical protein